MNIETKIRNIRFIGELCKFKVAQAGLVFTCLKVTSPHAFVLSNLLNVYHVILFSGICLVLLIEI